MSAPPARDTIFALSSGAPPAAIAVVRISGPVAGAALSALTGTLPASRRATLATVRDGDGALLDRALLLWFPGPASSTGEDLAEAHLHGGRATVAAVLAALAVQPGLRPAEPGEFTRRAFENGRIDLAQAEGLADLLSAETEWQRRHALRMAEGGLSGRVEQWRGELLALSARVEAMLEFGDDEGDVGDDPDLTADIARLAATTASALEVPPAERLRDGFRIVIAGPPNAGKSSLINRIADREVALATPIAGTTRDLIEAPVQIGGMPCILIDSAGLREADDPIERLGVERAEQAVAAADLILWLGRPDAAPAGNVIVVAPKSDLGVIAEPHDISVSAITGDGLERLRALISRRVAEMMPREDSIALNLRQRQCVRDVARELDQAVATEDLILCAAHLGAARIALDALTGRAGVEDMLDALFGRFCIGK